MNTYNKVIQELEDLKLITNLYRFQGGNSFKYFDIKKNKFDSAQEGKFIYLSSSQNHHSYFTVRRLRQLINQIILANTSYSVCNRQLNNPDSFDQIVTSIKNSDKINDIYSINLIHDSNLSTLFKENCCYPNEKTSHSSIERADRRVFNGGYGISNEWLELLELMNFFTAYYRIKTEDILELIHNMKINGKINSIINATFLSNNYNYKINPLLFNDFTKYEIMNILESIIDKKLYKENSNLASNPTSTIKKVVTEYQEKREKTLSLLNNKASKYY